MPWQYFEYYFRDHSRCGPGQLGEALLCNTFSHWLNPWQELSLYFDLLTAKYYHVYNLRITRIIGKWWYLHFAHQTNHLYSTYANLCNYIYCRYPAICPANMIYTYCATIATRLPVDTLNSIQNDRHFRAKCVNSFLWRIFFKFCLKIYQGLFLKVRLKNCP